MDKQNVSAAPKAPCPLAVWDAMSDSIANRRDECIERGQNVQAERYRDMIAGHREARAKVAELVAAARWVDECEDHALPQACAALRAALAAFPEVQP